MKAPEISCVNKQFAILAFFPPICFWLFRSGFFFYSFRLKPFKEHHGTSQRSFKLCRHLRAFLPENDLGKVNLKCASGSFSFFLFSRWDPLEIWTINAALLSWYFSPLFWLGNPFKRGKAYCAYVNTTFKPIALMRENASRLCYERNRLNFIKKITIFDNDVIKSFNVAGKSFPTCHAVTPLLKEKVFRRTKPFSLS